MALLNIEQGYNTTLHNRSPYSDKFRFVLLDWVGKSGGSPSGCAA
ncbi:hypothetical protein ACI61L_001745 [Neisseria gonorrhoeae]